MKYTVNVFIIITLIVTSCIGPIPEISEYNDFPSWNFDGDSIVYTSISNDEELSGLYIGDTCGNKKLIINMDVINLNWFPDGKRVLFKFDNIYSIKTNGDSLTSILNNEIIFNPSLSRNGKELLYNIDSNKIVLYSLNSELCKEVGIGLYPSWLSNNYQYIYVDKGEENTENKICISDTSGLNTTIITESNNPLDNYIYPIISPDGTQIIWMNNNDLEICSVDGSEKRLLISNGYYPSWSPDSKKIVFSRYKENEFDKAIFIMNINNLILKQLF